MYAYSTALPDLARSWLGCVLCALQFERSMLRLIFIHAAAATTFEKQIVFPLAKKQE
jgi:hypothetical protein